MTNPLVKAALFLVALLGILVAVTLFVLLPSPPAEEDLDRDRDADAAVDDTARDGRAEGRRRERVARDHVAADYCEVVEEDGAPADRATVVVALAHSPALRLMTAADGRAAWTPPPTGTSVFALREGVACSRDMETSGDERIVLRLGIGATLRGNVHWDDGRAAPNVVVEMSLWKRGYTTEWVTRTDRAGRFAFHGVPPGARLRPQVRHTLDVVPVGDTESVDAPEWGAAVAVSLLARQPGVAGVRVELAFPDGADVADSCVVEHLDAQGAQLTSADVRLDTETRLVAARIKAGVPTGLRITNGPFAGELAPLTLSDGEERTVSLAMHATGRLWLRAVDAEGSAAVPPGIVAHLLLEWGGEIEPLQGRGFGEGRRVDVSDLLPADAVLGASGARFHVVLDGPGIARGGLRSDRGPNLSLGGYELLHRLRSEGDVVLDVPLHRPMSATIVTVDAGGAVVPDVDVTLLPANGFRPATVRTNADGRAAVDVLLDTSEAERKSAWKRAKATAVEMHRGVAVLDAPHSPRATPEWRLVVEPLLRYRVRVVDASGVAVTAGHVESGRWERWPLDEEGESEILVQPGETVFYVGDEHESAQVRAPESGDEIVLVATPMPVLVLDIRAPSAVLEDDDPSVNVMIWTGHGSSYVTQALTGETTRVRVPLRGAGERPQVRINVVTGTGYHGSVESAPVDELITIVLEPRK